VRQPYCCSLVRSLCPGGSLLFIEWLVATFDDVGFTSPRFTQLSVLLMLTRVVQAASKCAEGAQGKAGGSRQRNRFGRVSGRAGVAPVA
jgi:hypothetical protein